jgi:hypothetical protein
MANETQTNSEMPAANPETEVETPAQRTARILGRVEREGLLPDVVLQLDQHKRMESARNACIAAMRDLVENPFGRDLGQVLADMGDLLEREAEEKRKFVALVARG